MRVNTVEKARKSPGNCSRCNREIAVGEPYRWAKGRYTSKKVRCMAEPCRFRQSDLTGSDKLSRVYAAQENVEDVLATWTPEDDVEGSFLQDALNDAAEQIKEVGEEYQQSADNILDAFSGGSATADELQEKAESLDSWATTLEDAANEIEPFNEEFDVEFDAESVERDDPERREGESDEDYKKRCDSEHEHAVDEARKEAVDAAREEWADNVRSVAESALSECPV